MIVSYITPTYTYPGLPEFKYLLDTYRSLLDQNTDQWEWILCPNGKAFSYDFTKFFPDKRVKVFPTLLTERIGELKKFACSQATGEIIAELDHDDMITPDCTEELLKAFEDHKVVFAYSNCAEFFYDFQGKRDYEPYLFNKEYGWRYRDFYYRGETLKEEISFEVSPASLRSTLFAPNHIRAWRTDAYWNISGHNSELNVIDDHDLAIRFYLYGKVVRIDKCLYLYRIHGKNSWIKYNKDVQALTHQIGNKYFRSLCKRWAEINNYRMLDLGGRFNSIKSYETVDVKKPADHIYDLRKDWDIFEDNSFGVVRAVDFLEHLPDKVHTMKEIHRILIPGGFFLSSTPSTDGRGAWQDPSHVSFWNQNSFWYFSNAQYAKYIDNKTIRFQEMRLLTNRPNSWAIQNDIPYVHFDAAALKDGAPRYPGRILI